jgi:hypothetical protein
MGAIPLGYKYDVVPIPPVEEATTYIDAGDVVIGVEFRRLTDEVVDTTFDAQIQAASGIGEARPVSGLDEQGVSLHVLDASTRLEYLRFDNFDDDPHYHYIVPGSHNVVIPFDTAASGDFITWALERIGSRLKEMLRQAGADQLAGRVVMTDIQAALPVVRETVTRADPRQAASR